VSSQTLTVAFASGMLAVVNPCGFAMLPAYVGYFLGLEGGEGDARAGLSRSLGVGLSVAAGFIAVFSVIGLVVYHLTTKVYEWSAVITMVIGAGLVVLGVAMLRGFEPVVNLPKLQRGGRTQGRGSMFVFGVSYAIASLSCALPLFIATVAGTFRRESAVASMGSFVAYSLGMTLVLLAITVSLGMARRGLVTRLRSLLPYVTRVSGLLLVLAGAYLAHYGWYERRVRAGEAGEGSQAVDLVTDWSADATQWVYDVGPTRFGLLLALGLLVVLVATFGLRTARGRS
jgi:cytochrome c-type biogenesis protein